MAREALIVRTEVELLDALDEFALREGISRNEAINLFLAEGLENNAPDLSARILEAFNESAAA